MRKRFLIGTAILAMAVCSLSGCGSSETNVVQATKNSEIVQNTETTAHIHESQGEWEKNGTEHWQICICGEKTETAAHDLDEFWICKTCGSEILDFGDIDVSEFDEYGNVISRKTFSADGELLGETSYEREYDPDGNILLEKFYDNGILNYEDTYKVNDAGEVYMVANTYFFDDGTKSSTRYDENGNPVEVQYYDENGKLSNSVHTEYDVDDESNVYEAKYTEIFEDGSKLIAEYNVYGDIVTRDRFDAEGNPEYAEIYNYGYNEEGEKDWIKEYRNDRLIKEITGYTTYEGKDHSVRYPEYVIDYLEDGSKFVMHYGERSDLMTESSYAADGSILQEISYFYEYDENDNRIDEKKYDGDRLIIHKEYGVNEDGWSCVEKETEYLENGGKVIREFNEVEEVTSETEYDAEGNVVQG